MFRPPAIPAPAALPPDWWQHEPDALLAALGSSPAGLAPGEAARRLARFGANRVGTARRRGWWLAMSRRLRNPLLLVLVAAGIASLVTGEGTSAWMIGWTVAASLLLDQIQQHRADSAAAKLSAQVAIRARVLRSGAEASLEVAELVPGDVVVLRAGSQVPADGVLLEGHDLFVQQSALTGESFPVEKEVRRAAGAAIEDAPCVLFMGSSVLSGTGTMLVCRTGEATQLGTVSGVVAADRGELALEADMRRFGAMILRIAFLLVLFVLLAGGMSHRPWLETFLFAVALAVGMTPELLPMVLTVSLSRGALRLAQQEVIVKRLASIHNLGSMDVLCTDKTGTLTEARIQLARHCDIDGTESAAVLENAFLNSHFESGIRTPLEDAVLAHGEVDPAPWRKIDEVPFDFERRRLSVLLDRAGERRLSVKGAPADVLAHCDRYLAAGGPLAWTGEARERAAATLRSLEDSGFRVLGVACKEVPATQESAGLKDESELVFAGFAAFLDPPKADARAALRALHAKGVEVKVLTGDSERVTRHLCGELGMPVKGVLLGSDIAHLDERALAQRARKANLFCRLDPMQKERVIQALRARGHVVGFLGDGINDAPALHRADVGISVDTGADTARASADLILLRHSLGVLSAAVTEGRRTFSNTRKYILLGTSSNFGNMISMAAAALFLPFLPMTALQILLNNLLYDFVSVALPLDRVDAHELDRPKHWDVPQLMRFMLVIGPVSSLFDMLTFVVLIAVLGAGAAQFQSGWFIESLATQVLAIFVIRTRGAALGSRPHPAVRATAGAIIAAGVLLPFTPLGPLFGLVVLPARFYAALVPMTAAYLVLLELAKRRFWRSAVRGRGLHPSRTRLARGTMGAP
ncbi:MAG TPA: magnesium-translocating P-type ATPase [Ramlibacter sp.]|uniref:magnesium-translocating P-type ATPase n=1 Tax=Ramlibacter sp. TaxID=1917967 RepID=UPI002D13FFA8|nr:magnesium-translocating P-type ATPase [Ramlibacter sp.]HVZ42835.1 magnesium-translocating P-type ATPase [Ramlibacter sp.]